MTHAPRTLALAALALPAPAFAQWSSNPAANLLLADRGNEQVQAKVRAAPMGGCYVSWFDNSAGGYDPTVQRLDAGGNEMFAHNGVTLADTHVSSTTDYDMAVDAQGRAVVAFQDDRPGGTQISAVMIAPDGTLPWGVGVTLTSGAGFRANPHVAAMDNGDFAVFWVNDSNAVLQRLSPTGVPLWLQPITITEAGKNLSALDCKPSNAGSVIVSWLRPNASGFGAPKQIRMQKYDAQGIAQWNAGGPVILNDGSGFTPGYFPTFLPDGAGGAVVAWYENGANRDAFVQHIDAGGVELFGHNGVSANTTADRLQLSASAAYNPASGEIFLSFVESNVAQSRWSLRAQRFSSAGARLWTDAGVEIVPESGTQPSFARTFISGNGCDVVYFENSSGLAGRVLAYGLDDSGLPVWNPPTGEVCSVVSVKSRLDGDTAAGGMVMLAWGDTRLDAGNIYAQNLNFDGSLGPPPCPADFNFDGFIDFFDFAAFIDCFEGVACPPGGSADFNHDGFVDFFDFADYVDAFEAGC